jgi:hypothetical protein
MHANRGIDCGIGRNLHRRIVLFLLLSLGSMSLAQGAIPTSERAALDAIYASTNGTGWTNKTGWGGAAGTECSWFGVSCNATSSNVVSIALGQNNLTGGLPSISALTTLHYFDVNVNHLTGSLPSLSGLNMLQVFWAGANQFTGSIPSLNGLTALQQFVVGNNQLTGSIPSLNGLTALQYLWVGFNNLTGSIPSLSGLTALYDFRADNNQLTGSIPSLSGLTALHTLYINVNQLSGPVPAVPASLTAAYLCGNGLASSGNVAIDAAWTTATGTNWLACQTSTTVAPSTPLPSPPTTQTVFTAPTGKLPTAAVSVSPSGTFGNATLVVTLDLSKVLAGGSFAGFGQFAAGYNIYVAALVPIGALGLTSATWFVLPATRSWTTLGSPIAAYMEGLAQNATDRVVISILSGLDVTGLVGAEIYVGYGLSDTEMLAAERYRGVYKVR